MGLKLCVIFGDKVTKKQANFQTIKLHFALCRYYYISSDATKGILAELTRATFYHHEDQTHPQQQQGHTLTRGCIPATQTPKWVLKDAHKSRLATASIGQF